MAFGDNTLNAIPHILLPHYTWTILWALARFLFLAFFVQPLELCIWLCCFWVLLMLFQWWHVIFYWSRSWSRSHGTKNKPSERGRNRRRKMLEYEEKHKKLFHTHQVDKEKVFHYYIELSVGVVFFSLSLFAVFHSFIFPKKSMKDDSKKPTSHLYVDVNIFCMCRMMERIHWMYMGCSKSLSNCMWQKTIRRAVSLWIL